MREKLTRIEKLEGVSDSLLACIFNSSLHAIIGMDAEGKIFRWSRGAERLAGYGAEEAMGKNIAFLFPADKWEAASKLFKQSRCGGEIKNMESAWLRKGGMTRQVLLNVSAICTETAGEIIGFTIIAQDVTERVEMQNALSASELRYRRLFETAGDGVLLLDAEDETIYDANPKILELLGYTLDELVGKKPWEICAFQDLESWKNAFQELRKKGITRFEDLPLRHKDGRIREVEFISTVYAAGPAKVIQCNIRDITDRKALDLLKDDFFAMMTHDLKSPLTTVMGYAELIQAAQPASREVIDMARQITKGGDKVLRMVNNFLAVSRLRQGGVQLNLVPHDISEILLDVSNEYSAMAKRKGIALETDISELPAMLIDRAYFERALSNLLENALIYTKSGGKVTVKADCCEKGVGKRQNDEFMTVSVSDTGPGIHAEELKDIFDKFYRSPRTAKTRGTGLGLAVVKATTEALGGRVSVESEPGRGSIFKMLLPVTEPS